MKINLLSKYVVPVAATLALAAMAGCTSVANPTLVCPIHVKEWTKTEQAVIFGESESFSDSSIMIPVLEDYATMRDEARTCLKNQ